jgi:hypothetical protein
MSYKLLAASLSKQNENKLVNGLQHGWKVG